MAAMSNKLFIIKFSSCCRKLPPLFSSSTASSSSLLINSNPLFHLSRRGFSQRRRNTQTYSDGGTIRAVDFMKAFKSVALSQMEAQLKALRHDLAKSSTGKACVEMADHIFLVTNGVKIPLNKMASVSLWDPKHNPHILLVTPHDPHTAEEMEKAAVESPYGVSLSLHREDNFLIHLRSLTWEEKQAAWNLVINSCKRGKESIRRVRRKARDTIKNSTPKKKEKEKTGLSIAGLSADDVKKLEKEVEEKTKKYLELIGKICILKLKEIVGRRW